MIHLISSCPRSRQSCPWVLADKVSFEGIIPRRPSTLESHPVRGPLTVVHFVDRPISGGKKRRKEVH